MDRREFLKYTTLGALLGTELLSSLSCGDDYCGYSSSSDEAKIIRMSREAIKSGLERKKEPPYIRHGIDQKSKHPLVFQDNYLVEMYPPGTGIDSFGILRSKGRVAIAYTICKDECGRTAVFPGYHLAKIAFLEDEEKGDWEPFSFKHPSVDRLSSKEKSIFDRLKR